MPGHWRSTPEFAAQRRPIALPLPLRDAAALRVRNAVPGCSSTGSSTTATSGSTGPTSATPRATFSPTPSRSPTPWPSAREHLLAVEVACTPPTDRRAKRNLTGVFQHWDYLDRDWNPGGIWRPVRLIDSGPVRIGRLRVRCPEATAERATLDLRAGLDAQPHRHGDRRHHPQPGRRPARRRMAQRPTPRRRRQPGGLAGGRSTSPELWWPPPSATSRCTTSPSRSRSTGEASDRRAVRTGLRQVRMRNFVASVNGERLFLKGANQGPTRRALAEASAEDFEADVLLARRAGLDLLRVHGHISRPELYDAADRHGLLLWQDLPLQSRLRPGPAPGHAPGHRGGRPARPPSLHRGVVRPQRAGGHGRRSGRRDGREDTLPSHHSWVGFAAGQTLPTVNKTRLDRSVRRTLEKADGSRPVVAHSGVFPHPAWGTDTHLYLGWQYGDERDLPALLARLPVLGPLRLRVRRPGRARASADFCEPERWPDLDWAHLARAHALQKATFDRYVPPGDYDSFEAWRARHPGATRPSWSASTSRRCAGSSTARPAGSACSCSPTPSRAVSWSVLDHERVPKAGLRRPGRRVRASDRRRRPPGAELHARDRPSTSTSTW